MVVVNPFLDVGLIGGVIAVLSGAEDDWLPASLTSIHS